MEDLDTGSISNSVLKYRLILSSWAKTMPQGSINLEIFPGVSLQAQLLSCNVKKKSNKCMAFLKKKTNI